VKFKGLSIPVFVAALLLSAGRGPLSQSAAPAAPADELQELARGLRESGATADYDRLRAFSERHAADEFGARAALALGYQDFQKKRYAAAQDWFDRATDDPLLAEYALYWSAQVRRATGQNAEALPKLEKFRREYPESVMAEKALESFAEAAIAVGQPERAAQALEKYPQTASRPALLLLQAQALEKIAGKKAAARRLYQEIYYGLPLSDEAKTATRKLTRTERSDTGARQMERAAAFYDARRWREARAEYAKFRSLLKSKQPLEPALEKVALRYAECRARLGASPNVVASLKLSTPEIDAERLYVLAQRERARSRDARMLRAVEQAAAQYPQSRWTAEALFAAGNSFWVDRDRERAAQFYRRVVEKFPNGSNAMVAHWRVAWTDYLARRPQAEAEFEEHLRRFPGSPMTPNAIYWLGRLAERNGNVPHARSFYLKLVNRFPETYFGRLARERMAVVGAGPTNPSEALALIPAAGDPPQWDAEIPAAAQPRWERAQALRTIGFDASAEQELRAAHAATGSPRLLLETAKVAMDGGRNLAGIAAARQAYPQLEARRVEDGPEEVWRLVYPRAYHESIEEAAARADIDPMLVMGLIRQESTFQPDAVSRAGAVGLMQVLPRTGYQLARRLRLRYSRRRLTNPEYNLRLGTVHLARILERFGQLEVALAAYNAGESRAVAWQAERDFEEPAEFVESIPFTETREYVQVVIRNAEVYRRLYGRKP